MLRCPRILLRTATAAGGDPWLRVRTAARHFRPPSEHVLFDSIANKRFNVTTIPLASPSSSPGVPDLRSGFLLHEGDVETTTTTSFSDPVAVDASAVALMGAEGILTAATDDAKPKLPAHLPAPTKLFLLRFDPAAWLAPEQADVIARNLAASSLKQIVVCNAQWFDAIKSGCSALQRDTAKASDDKSKKDKKTAKKNKKKDGDDGGSNAAAADLLTLLKPGDVVAVSERRRIQLCAESWCGHPIIEDAATRSLFTSAGLAASLPWMEMFSASSEATRMHPPFILPFWTSSSSSSSFDAAQSLALVRFLLRRSPQRIFLERSGLVSPADEFLEKLEVVAEELVRLQNNVSSFVAAEKSKSSTTTIDDGKMLDRVTKRLVETIMIGDKHGGDSGGAIFDSARRAVEVQRRDDDAFDAACRFVEEEVRGYLAAPFLKVATDSARRANKNQTTATQAVATTVKQEKTEPKRQGDENLRSPRGLANVARSRLGGGASVDGIVNTIIDEEIDLDIFCAMTETEMKTIFSAHANFGTMKKLLKLQKALEPAASVDAEDLVNL